MAKTIQELFDQYSGLAAIDDIMSCCDLAQSLDDATAKALYEKLAEHPDTRNKLVKPLWFNYNTQQFRWTK